MAARLRLANRSQTSTVDLLGGTLKVSNAWQSRTAQIKQSYNNMQFGSQAEFIRFEKVTENLSLFGEGTDTQLIAADDAIQDVIEANRLWHADGLRDESWWLEMNTANENAKRALIFNMSMLDRNIPGVNHFLSCDAMKRQLNIVRHPLWENTAASTITATAVAGMGGTHAIGTIPGTAPARIKKITITPNTFADTNYSWFIGIRPQRNNTLNEYLTLWDAGSGLSWNGTSTNIFDVTASTNTRRDVQWSIVTTALAKRWSIIQEQIDPLRMDSYNGKYLVLMRYKVTAGSTVYIEMRNGYEANTNKTRSQGQYIESSSWITVNLGQIEIPPQSLRGEQSSWANTQYGFELWAQHISGTVASDLFLIDTFTLVPVSNSIGIVQTISAATNYTDLYRLENDQLQMIHFDTSGARPEPNNSGYIFSKSDWYLPVGNSYFVLSDNETNLTNTYDISIQYYPRWKSYRSS